MIANEQLDFLKEILSTSSPSGCEGELTSLLIKRMSNLCEIETDAIGNLYMWVSKSAQSPTIMITAHADEVGFQVTYIDDDGYVYFRSVASPDVGIIPGSEVVALTKKGKIYGVVGKIPPHILEWKDREKNITIQDLWLDFGFDSYNEASEYIDCGDYITLYSSSKESINGKRIISKAIDNKAGVFCLTEIIVNLKELNLPLNIVCVATTQEELGSRGCVIAANKVKPDISLIIDAGISTDTPNISKKKYGILNLGKGVGIIRNADNNECLIKTLIDTAKRNNILFQKIIGFRPTGGNEASKIQLSEVGVLSANICIPCRYMHSGVEMCDFNDINAAVTLITLFIDGFINDQQHLLSQHFNHII